MVSVFFLRDKIDRDFFLLSRLPNLVLNKNQVVLSTFPLHFPDGWWEMWLTDRWMRTKQGQDRFSLRSEPEAREINWLR